MKGNLKEEGMEEIIKGGSNLEKGWGKRKERRAVPSRKLFTGGIDLAGAWKKGSEHQQSEIGGGPSSREQSETEHLQEVNLKATLSMCAPAELDKPREGEPEKVIQPGTLIGPYNIPLIAMIVGHANH